MKERKLAKKSLCFISGNMNHDTSFVYQVMKNTVHFLKEEISSQVTKINYFSDGCAGKKKNCKNFLNLCLHEKDFGVKCNWTFFATSHGKSPCDGFGGTLKSLTGRASLQRPVGQQILTAIAVYKYCKEEIKGINVFYISADEINVVRQQLEERFSNLTTLPRTRGFLDFTPISEWIMAAK